MFGRFLEIYDELPTSDYNKYQEIVDVFLQQILNFKIDDDADAVLLPYVRIFKPGLINIYRIVLLTLTNTDLTRNSLLKFTKVGFKK